jgi:teichuronic acid biosynthesis glycosyltransferase TuaG
MMRKVDLSIIIPFYNELNLIGDAVASIYAQTTIATFRFQIIVVNDGTYDNNTVLENVPKSRLGELVVVTNEQARGAGGARNTGVDMSEGTYIAFLDADDYWLKEKMELQIPLFIEGVTFLATGYSFHECSGSAVKPPLKIRSKLELLKNTNVGTSTVIIDRIFLGKSRFSNREFSQDTELWAKLADDPSFRYDSVPSAMTVYRPSLRTRNKAWQAFYFFKLCRDLNLTLLQLIQVMWRYSFNGLRRHLLNMINGT